MAILITIFVFVSNLPETVSYSIFVIIPKFLVVLKTLLYGGDQSNASNNVRYFGAVLW